MKPILVVSLILNVTLATVIVAKVVREPAQRQAPMKAESKAPASEADTATSASLVVARESTVRAFRWDQVESTDDGLLMDNLRAISCPESTITDLLSARIGHRYDAIRDGLRVKGQKGELDTAGLEEAIAKAWDEQNELLARLAHRPASYGADGAVVRKNASQGSPTQEGAVSRQVPPSSNHAPVVFMEADPSWGLDAKQLAVWEQINDGFVEQIGGAGQNPSDPAYRERWMEAQRAADQRVRQMFGDAIYNKVAARVPGWMSEHSGH